MDVVFDVGARVLLVVEDVGSGIVMADDAVVGDAEPDHADGAFLAETHAVAKAMTREGDTVGGAVVEDGEKGGAELEVGTDTGEGDTADAYFACGLAEGEQFVADAIVGGVEFVFA